jgi:hypothetical protein
MTGSSHDRSFLVGSQSRSSKKPKHKPIGAVSAAKICTLLTSTEVKELPNGKAATGPGVPSPSTTSLRSCTWSTSRSTQQGAAQYVQLVVQYRKLSAITCTGNPTYVKVHKGGWSGCLEKRPSAGATLAAREGEYQVIVEPRLTSAGASYDAGEMKVMTLILEKLGA